MDFLLLVFRLGVVLAIFSFIWALIQLGLALLQAGRPIPYPLSLTLKVVQYFLIADVTVIFCYSRQEALRESLIFAGFILLIYFLGKVSAAKNRFVMVQIQNSFSVPKPQKVNLRLELIPLFAGLASYIFFAIKPEFAENPAAEWFYRSITDIEKTPVFGFIFKVVGFFFSLSIIFRLISAFSLILSGEAFRRNNDGDDNRNSGSGSDQFDYYEEVD